MRWRSWCSGSTPPTSPISPPPWSRCRPVCPSPWHRWWTGRSAFSAAPCPSSGAAARTTGHWAAGSRQADRAAANQVRALLRAGRTARVELGGDADTCPEKLTLLVHTQAAPPRMLIFGAIDFAAALSQAGRFLGYHVTVCDARPVFATTQRFPHADEVVVDWPHRYLEATEVDARTAICVLTHDAKFDIPLLRLALGLPVGYIGAMGSRRTHEHRLARLREAGVPDEHLALLHSPIGLDLGAHTPEETAISITAELIARVNNGTGLPLSRVPGPIHGSVPVAGMSPSSVLAA
ncbi:xanthine dehydrogenase accessory factor [Streptomyces azureus]|uniref:Xanthine dehydrogenase accessory factor n=1 Tax=Streptomyces azureus TaxID=146537 RepID=A0A0K8PYG5_STRAJ|nr:xanthine dehydrogenase accessory factor [Streptomyces azureus]